MGGAASGSGGSGAQAAQTASGVGESCLSRTDCAVGLACVNQTCVTPETPFKPTGKECQAVQCIKDDDCCPVNTDSKAECASFASLCAAGEKYYCNQYSYYCVCSAAKCENYQCTFTQQCDTQPDCAVIPGNLNIDCDTAKHVCVNCTSDAFCNIRLGVQNAICNANQQCVIKECTLDADCPSGNQKCVLNQCVTTRQCYDDKQCGADQQCDDASGKCVDRACTDDRFCADLLGTANAKCMNEKCVEPCTTTYECNGGNTWGNDSKLCVDGFCVEAGCESNAECDVHNYNGYLMACLPPGTAPQLAP
jgi:hypothetical protein